MEVLPISAFSDNYIWVILDKATGFFDCVDPGEAAPILDFAAHQSLKLRAILLTHHHHDHLGGVAELIRHTPSAEVFGPKDPRIPYTTHQVKEHEVLNIGSCSYKILFNPGHTSSHISYYETQHKWLFCGDTLFSAGCGRVFEGTMAEMHQSLQLFKSLPPQTKVFCAHEYTKQNLQFARTVEPDNTHIQNYLNQLPSCTLPSTIGQELLINPFLRTTQATVQQYAQQHGACSNNSLTVFSTLRKQKDNF